MHQLRALATSWAETTSGPPTATMTLDWRAASHVWDAGDEASVVGATRSSTPLLAAAAGPALMASGRLAQEASQGGPVITAAAALEATAADGARETRGRHAHNVLSVLGWCRDRAGAADDRG